MTVQVRPLPIGLAFTNAGAVLASGKVYTYAAGTTTLKATYQDAAGAVQHTNPIILDSAGRATVYWGSGLYKVRVTDSAGVLVWEVDNFDAGVADAVVPTANLVQNGSCEVDTDSDGVPDAWTAAAYVGGTVDTDRYNASTNPTPDVLDGQAALRFTHPGGSGKGGGYATSDNFPVAPGSQLWVEGWIKSSVANTHARLEMRWYTKADVAAATASTSVYDDQATVPTAWTKKTGLVNVPSDATLAVVRVYGGINDNTTAGVVRWDRIIVYEPGRAQNLNGFGQDTGTTASTIPVRDGTGKLPGSITGDADTVDGQHAAAFATASHTTPASSDTAAGHVELATSAETQTGTDATRAVTPAGLSASSLGFGQTWQDMSGSRAAGASYTNSTGRPIMVAVSVKRTAAVSDIYATVGGVTVSHDYNSGTNALDRAWVGFVVPNGASYVVQFTAANIDVWAELR